IVAVKGLGGFHLLVDARNDDAVRRLRVRKHREEKPFAVLFPSLAAIEAECELRTEEIALLTSTDRPIVLVRRRTPSGPGGAGTSPRSTLDLAGRDNGVPAAYMPTGDVAASVAPGNPTVGAMLPYTPLHYLVMAELRFPVVATSGNRSEEPIVTDESN